MLEPVIFPKNSVGVGVGVGVVVGVGVGVGVGVVEEDNCTGKLKMSSESVNHVEFHTE
jgi:hypothetical protein